MATSTTTAASNHTEVVASSSDSVAESLDITPKKKRSSSKRSKRRVNAVSEDDPLIIVDPGSNFENLDRRYSYHIDVSTRQLVVQGAKELLEKPYKHRFYASIIVNCTIVAILTAANLAALIYHLVTWTLPGRLVLYGLIILMTLGMLACAATTWTALMVARVAADNIMNLRYNQSWVDEVYRGELTGRRIAPGWQHTPAYTDSILPLKPLYISIALLLFCVLPCFGAAVALLVVSYIRN